MPRGRKLHLNVDAHCYGQRQESYLGHLRNKRVHYKLLGNYFRLNSLTSFHVISFRHESHHLHQPEGGLLSLPDPPADRGHPADGAGQPDDHALRVASRPPEEAQPPLHRLPIRSRHAPWLRGHGAQAHRPDLRGVGLRIFPVPGKVSLTLFFNSHTLHLHYVCPQMTRLRLGFFYWKMLDY